MKTKHHLIVALVDGGIPLADAVSFADDAFGSDDPRVYIEKTSAELEKQLAELTVRVTALRHILNGEREPVR